MKPERIKAVVFDYGGVISFLPEPRAAEEMAAIAGVKTEDLAPLLSQSRGDYDRGVIGPEEFFRSLLGRLQGKAEEGQIRRVIEKDMLSWSRLNPGTLALMKAVRRAGFKTGILSNMPMNFLTWARKNLEVFSFPDGAVFSCEVRSIKPEEAIYRALFAALNLSPREMVFFDDMEPNVKKARELGMEAFLWQGPEKAAEDLSALGLTLC